MPEYRLARIAGSPRWYITWSDGRRSRRASTGTTNREQAQRILAAFILERQTPRQARPEEVALATVLEDYYEHHASNLPSAFQARIAIDDMIEHYGTSPVSVLAGVGHRTYQQRCEGQGLSPASINRRRAVLRAALNFAAKDTHRLAVAPHVPTLQEGPPRPTYLTRSQAARILWASRRSPHVALFIRIALYTGARMSAILQLTWDRVDLELGTVDFRLPGVEHRKKKRAARPIPLRLLAALRRAYKHKRRHARHVIEYHGAPIASVKTAFRLLRKATRIPVTAHVLKHTAATWGLQKATSWEMAGLLATSQKTLERVYGKHEVEHLREASERAARGGVRKKRAKRAARQK